MTVTPLLQPSAGRSRVQAAAELIQQGLRQLWAEERERAERQRSFRVAPFSEREQALINKAELRRIKQQHLISIDRRWFWSLVSEVQDEWREQADQAQKRGEASRVGQLADRLDRLAGELEKIQEREAGR
jgi:hypothetical protein